MAVAAKAAAMGWRRTATVRLGWFSLTGVVTVAVWGIYERSVAGGAYRWTTWRELTHVREPAADGPPPGLGQGARSLVGQAVFLVAQKGDWIAGNGDKFWPVVHMPNRQDLDVTAISVGVRTSDAAAFEGSDGDGWGLVRIWGRLRPTPSGAHGLPAPYKDEVPLELDVDRFEPDPPFLPAAIAPTTPTAWLAWALSCGLAGTAFGPSLRLLRRSFRVRVVAMASSAVLLLVAISVAAVWVFIPGREGIELYNGKRTLNLGAGRGGLVVQWAGDYAGYSIPAVRTYRYKGPSDLAAGALGLRLHSYYTRYDWGNVHAHVDLVVSPPGLAGVCGLLGYVAFRRSRTLARTPGRCVGCGYDLRATPSQCPECGRVTRVPAVPPRR